MVASTEATRCNPTIANLARIDAWLDGLADAVDEAAQSEELTRYLQILARFWTYSARNCWLIGLQMPEARRVASRKTWESLGRTIRRDHWRRGLEILCPHFRTEKDGETGEDRQVLVRFSTGYVFDISQTEGRPLAADLWQEVAGEYTALYTALLTQVRRCGLVVEECATLPEGVHGYSTGAGRLVVRADGAPGNRCQTVLHELAHERCHGIMARRTFGTTMLECQAEAIAYCCSQILSIYVSDNLPLLWSGSGIVHG